ncbi:zona pellucida sperm-binding protein 4-like isoform X2 [Dunckerocampus dactyliophorus]|uniref:zona pellucida sperm-binding protein 4-like isoform X2 n=1 Tax=Dunckerocampus dactyliophorus TaxID=161453 RepID=UPI00240714FE|nr:zona pellucida sperm-binding protein 4-like isoform X2 [Dunckerocampus dactyliophorus]
MPDMAGSTFTVPQSEGSCGVQAGRRNNQSLVFFSRYDSCYAQVKGSKAVVPLQVQLTGEDGWFRVNISCPLTRRSTERTQLSPTPSPGDCAVRQDLRVKCGQKRLLRDSCANLGCCFDSTDSTCYYKLGACSLDGHLLFSVKTTDAGPPMDPRSLVVKDHPRCIPVIATADTAVFKIQATDCGVKAKVDGDVVIYELELQELHEQRRDNRTPFSLQIECEYKASNVRRAVKFRPLHAVTTPPPVVALGSIKVQMRIATDASFTFFFPEDQLPLMLPLRKAAYVEVSIAQPSPDPTLSLHVRDCFAYPASRHSVWTLLYNGCPNPLDDSRSSVPVDKQGKTHSHSQVRRFDVKTFAFLDQGEPSVEEIYFYCWVEICTEEVDCAQPCAIISQEGERRRREALFQPHPFQLISVGPLLLGQNSTEPEENLRAHQISDMYPLWHRGCSDDAAADVSEQQEVPQARRNT